MENKVILDVRKISKSFIGVKALTDVSLDVRHGEVHAIVGENGAGKTTLMKILSGAYPHSSYTGSILIDGEEMHFNTPKEAQDAGVAMIYQEIDLIPELSICENVMVGFYQSKAKIFVDWHKMEELTKAALKQVGLNLSIREKVKNLSTSQQQMVAIAKAIIRKPRILVLDEPTSSLTENEKDYLFKIITELRDTGISCIYISHKIEEVLFISNRITVLRDGKKIDTVCHSDFDIKKVINMMVGRDMKDRYPHRIPAIGDEVLKVEHLTIMHKYIEDKKIIDDISFSLRKGEILGLAGLVGSGRSELVNAVFGNRKTKTSCAISINGKQRNITDVHSAIANGLALLTEDRRVSGIFPALSVKNNATVVALSSLFPHGVVSRTKELDVLEKYMKGLNIKAKNCETPIKNLSGGNQQKVVLAKWLLKNPQIMILDEPTRGIDVGTKYEIYTLINSLTDNGVSCIVISSELPELLGICDRFLVIYNGKITAEYTADNVSEEKIMAAATGVTLS